MISPPPEPRIHISFFAIGQRFRYRENGPIFRRVGSVDGPIKVEVEVGHGRYAGDQVGTPLTFVLPVDQPARPVGAMGLKDSEGGGQS